MICHFYLISNFSFFHSVFKRLVLQTSKKKRRACLGKGQKDRLIRSLTLFSTLFQLYCIGQNTNPFPPWIFLLNSFSKLLAAFPHKHLGNDGQWGENNDYHHSLEQNRTSWESNQQPYPLCYQLGFLGSAMF